MIRFHSSVPLLTATLLAATTVASCGGKRPPADEASKTERPGKAVAGTHVEEGISVRFELEPVGVSRKPVILQAGDTIDLRLRVSDTTSKTALSGAFPAAWIDKRASGDPTTPAACKEKVEGFVGGSLLAPPQIDLNTYLVLALNSDATVTIVDPLFGFGTTKLRAMLVLESVGADWQLSRDARRLFVSMPDAGKVAAADATEWKIESNIDVGPGVGRLRMQADGEYLWAAYDGGVAAIDPDSLEVAHRFELAGAPHDLVLDDGDRQLFVASAGAGTVTVIDVASLEKVAELPAGETPGSLVYSGASRAVYTTSASDGVITAIDAANRKLIGTLRAEPGITQIALAPGGRLAFAVNPEKDLLRIIDTSLNQIIQTGKIEGGPDQVAFSDELAYVRRRGSEVVLMIPLDSVGKPGQPVPVVDFPGGRVPFGQGKGTSLGAGIVQAPGATAVLVANPVDKTIYYYKEGMAAPMGNFQNYGHEPMAVSVIDRSLAEVSPGTYGTTTSVLKPGLYDLAVFLDVPRIVHCFPFEVAPDPEWRRRMAKHVPVSVESMLGVGKTFQRGESVKVRFKLTDTASGDPKQGVRDVRILAFASPGVDRQERVAKEIEPGVYEASIQPGRAGTYFAFAQADSVGVTVQNRTQTIFTVK